MINSVDYQENKEINYTEFLSATVHPSFFKDEKRIRGLFNLFDVDNSGNITVDNLVQTFSKFGRQITGGEIEQAMAQHDMKHDGQISFEEFKLMI